jgi:hypothetical protein
MISSSFPNFYGNDTIEIGPTSEGHSSWLISKLNLLADDSDLAGRADNDAKVLQLLLRVKHDFSNLPYDASDEQARQVLMNLVNPLMSLHKCPDYVVNRGHYFGTDKLQEERLLATKTSVVSGTNLNP